MKNKIFKYIIYSIILFSIFCICLNSTTRRLIRRIFEIHKLQANIEEATKINLKYKKRLEYLLTKPKQIDRIVKSDLGLLAEGEVEYRFDDYPEETKLKD